MENFDNLFNDYVNIRFGCVMFDLQDDGNGKSIPMPGSGWASISGDVAFRIKSSGDLSSDVRWLTNLSQDVFWKSGLVRQSKLKPSNYLRTDLGQIMKELGLYQPKVQIVEICQIIASFFSKIMKMAIKYYDISEFMQKDLATEIKHKLYPNDVSISLPVDEALSRSYQDLVLCEKPITKEKLNFVTLKRPRLFHAKSILDTAIPSYSNNWNFFGDDLMPVTTNEKIDFLVNMNKPFIVKLEIKSFTNHETGMDLSGLLNLGDTIGDGGKKKTRNWVCQPELLYLSKFADLEISAAFVANEYESLEKKAELPDFGELSNFSYALGILSECLWVGLASRSINPKTRNKSLVTPRACWLKSTDRFMTLTSAMLLVSSGFHVINYGYGGVTVAVEDYRIKDLIEISSVAGLCAPLSVLEDLD